MFSSSMLNIYKLTHSVVPYPLWKKSPNIRSTSITYTWQHTNSTYCLSLITVLLLLLLLCGTTTAKRLSHQNLRRAIKVSDPAAANEHYGRQNELHEPYRKEIPLTYRLHSDLLRYYKKGTRPVVHPNKLISVTMSVFLYQIIKLVRFYLVSLKMIVSQSC